MSSEHLNFQPAFGTIGGSVCYKEIVAVSQTSFDMSQLPYHLTRHSFSIVFSSARCFDCNLKF
ncbi:hypothetical protein RchiOBHm_Chr5g0079781 [Rosa chinensis]|uniref:Uncharacterized protein n=1 Tax=Rosa chinensis TaxID=74649 RepID=A0A2P6QMM6_ROSCH|nr:hypothetical protein RchiOBHm_Chr5g0079781 [Rosa chinensis]